MKEEPIFFFFCILNFLKSIFFSILPLHLSDVFQKSLKVKKLSEIITAVSESVQVGIGREFLDVNILVSKLKVRADNSVCFVLGNYSLAKSSFFTFNYRYASFNIELILVDPRIFTWRTISIHKLRIQGDRLLVGQNQWRTYNLDLNQYVFVEKDPTKNCTVYPNSEYESYGKCDQAYVQTIIPGIVPIWNTDDISKATRNFKITEEEKYKVMELSEGLVVSPCKLPCTSTKATAQLSWQSDFSRPGFREIEIGRPHFNVPYFRLTLGHLQGPHSFKYYVFFKLDQ